MKRNSGHRALSTQVIAISAFLSIQLSLTAQDSLKFDSPEQKAKCHVVNFANDENEIAGVPFNSISVYDVRPDTTKLGYVRADITNALLRLCLPAGEFGRYYRSFLTGNGTSLYSLEIFVTKGWITSNEHNASELWFTAEIFMKSESGFHPLYRFDTSLKKQGTTKFVVNELENMMKASVKKLSKMNYQSKLKKVLSADVIAARYARAQHQFSRVKNKGVYMTYQEFKEDKPAHKDFHVDFSKLTDELYIRERDGSLGLTRGAWGFFDGKDLFIRRGDNYFPVDQEGTVLNFFGASELKKEVMTHLTLPPTMISPATIMIDYFVSSKKRKLVKLKPFQVNYQTGEVY